MSKHCAPARGIGMSIVNDTIAGTIAGVGLCLVGHPFDTLKVRLQAQSSINPVYNGLWDCVKQTARNEGVRGFYKGVQSPLVGQMIFRASIFAVMGQARVVFHCRPNTDEFSWSRSALAGGMTGIVISAVESPIDLFKSQQQVKVLKGEAKEPMMQLIRRLYVHAGGVRAMYQGLQGTVLRNIPANSMYFAMYDRLRSAQWTPLQAGALGGLFYWLACYPLDVVKSALQGDAPRYVSPVSATSVPSGRRQYASYLDCVQQLYREGGAGRFLKGITPCLMRSMPANAVLFTLFEGVHEWLR